MENFNEYRTIFETAGTAMVIVGKDTIISLANIEFEKLSGYSKEEIEGKKSWAEFVGKHDLEKMKKYHHARRIDPSAAPKCYEFQFVDKYFNLKDILVTVNIVPGTPKTAISLLDITELKKTELVAEKSQNKYRFLVENVRDVIFALDPQGYIDYMSPVIEQLSSYKLGELLGQHFAHFVYPDDIPGVSTFFNQVMAGQTEKYEFRILDKDGTVRFVSASNRPQFANNQVVGLTGIITDITKRKQTEKKLKQSIKNFELVVKQSIQAMAKLTETRDPYTAMHQRGVSKLASTIAKEMNLPEEDIEVICLSGIIHDIGKIYVPAEILTKPGRISETEFDMIKSHPQVGYDILRTIEFPWPIAQIVYQHHERVDGSGYPLGLSGEEILLEAKILAIADVVEAMASHRPYRPAVGIYKALDEISKNKGITYDSNVVDTCIRLFTEKGFMLNR